MKVNTPALRNFGVNEPRSSIF